MSIQEQVLTALCDEVDKLGLYASIVNGPLPAGNSLSCLPAGGGVVEFTHAHGGTYSANFAVNGQHAEQAKVRDALYTIHEHLNKLQTYPTGTGWAVCGIRTINAPEYLDRDEGRWLYGSSIAVDYVVD